MELKEVTDMIKKDGGLANKNEVVLLKIKCLMLVA